MKGVSRSLIQLSWVFIFQLLMFVSPGDFSFAATLLVPSGHDTIQAAITAAENGDTILVDPGTYSAIDYAGKSLTIMSAQGAAKTIIDAKQGGCAVDMTDVAHPGASITGFTIENGTGRWDVDRTWGGGVYSANSIVTISNNLIRDNNAANGGGICLRYCGATVYKNLIMNNGARYGGGVHLDMPTTSYIVGNEFRSNLAHRTGPPSTYVIGGGLYSVNGAPPIVFNNLFNGNIAEGDGVTSFVAGGGIGIASAVSFIVKNCTFVNNIARSGSRISGGGISESGGGTAFPHVSNSVFWGNSPSSIYLGLYYESFIEDIELTLDYSLLPAYSYGASANSEIIDEDGIINSEPLFASGAQGNYYLSQTAAGQMSTSPAVDAGSDTAANTCGSIGTCLDNQHTRTDEVTDSGIVDLGFHYPAEGLPTAPPSGVNPSITTILLLPN